MNPLTIQDGIYIGFLMGFLTGVVVFAVAIMTVWRMTMARRLASEVAMLAERTMAVCELEAQRGRLREAEELSVQFVKDFRAARQADESAAKAAGMKGAPR